MSSKVLVADDDITLRHLLVKQLDKLSFRADSAGNGREAVLRVQSHQYCLILMDIQMPDMSGLEATAAIRLYEEQNGLQPVTIIAISAGYSDRETCTAHGIDDLLQKPISIMQLRAIFQKWVA